MGKPCLLFCCLSVQSWHMKFCSSQGTLEILPLLCRLVLLLLQDTCFVFWLIWYAFSKLILTFFPSAAFILDSLCKITTSCTESPTTNKSPFASSLTCENLRPGWCCLNSPKTDRQVLNFSSITLRMTGIVFPKDKGLRCTGVSGGSSEDLVLCRVGSVGELVAVCFLRLRVTSVNSSSWLTDDMVKRKSKERYGRLTQKNNKLE